MALIPTFASLQLRATRFALIFVCAALFAACSSTSATVDEQIEAANGALARNDFDGALKQCNFLAEKVMAADTTITPNQAANLAILFMKLSDARHDDDNVGTATLCFRHALELSPDSLRAFSQTLSLEDQRHFELLWRIGVSIDNPVDVADLTEDEEGEAAAADAFLSEMAADSTTH